MTNSLKKTSQSKIDIAISEQNGVRFLHLGGRQIQSAMKIDAPNELELLYTQYMMGFLLFQPDLSDIVMIGLGGGSLAKFVYHQMPQTKTKVIEINEDVINAAINHFAVPRENAHLQIILADGAEYIYAYSHDINILMIDGFNGDCLITSLCSQEFYDQAYQVLSSRGILVVNLLGRDKNLNVYLGRIKNSFRNQVITVLTEARGNVIVFAFKHNPGRLSWKTLGTRAKRFKEMYGLPFPAIVSKLCKSNLLLAIPPPICRFRIII